MKKHLLLLSITALIASQGITQQLPDTIYTGIDSLIEAIDPDLDALIEDQEEDLDPYYLEFLEWLGYTDMIKHELELFPPN